MGNTRWRAAVRFEGETYERRRALERTSIAVSVLALVLAVPHWVRAADTTASVQTASSAGHAASKKKPAGKYTAPKGFARYEWGDALKAFKRLKENPVTLQLAYSEGRREVVDFMCAPTGSMQTLESAQAGGAAGSLDSCDYQRALSTVRQRTDGRGFHLFGEFVVPNQGFRLESTDIVLYPVTYQFCANWKGGEKSPEEMAELLTFCGMRMVFQSQTLEQMEAMSSEELTTYERVLEHLIGKYGKPKGYKPGQRVIVETADGRFADPRSRRLDTYRWCPPTGGRFVPTCEASIVLGFSPESGNGVILYATPAVWEFAYARNESVQGGDPMYRFMHAKGK